MWVLVFINYLFLSVEYQTSVHLTVWILLKVTQSPSGKNTSATVQVLQLQTEILFAS